MSKNHIEDLKVGLAVVGIMGMSATIAGAATYSVMKPDDESSIVEELVEATESTTTTESYTTTITTTAEPTKPLLILDMQRRLDVISALIRSSKDEVEAITKKQNTGESLTDDEHGRLAVYADLLYERDILNDTISKLENKTTTTETTTATTTMVLKKAKSTTVKTTTEAIHDITFEVFYHT